MCDTRRAIKTETLGVRKNPLDYGNEITFDPQEQEAQGEEEEQAWSLLAILKLQIVPGNVSLNFHEKLCNREDASTFSKHTPSLASGKSHPLPPSVNPPPPPPHGGCCY